jgi:cytochrome P450
MIQPEKQIPTIQSTKLLQYSFALINNPLKAISSIVAAYGDISLLKISKIGSIVFVNHPDYVKHILKDNQNNYSRRKAIKQPGFTGLQNLLGNGIFMSDGDDWEAQHKLLRQLFSVTSINATLPIINHEVATLIANWQKCIPKNPVIAIESEMYLLLLKIMLRSHVSNELTYDYDRILQALKGFMDASGTKSIFMAQFKAFVFKPFGVKYTYTKPDRHLQQLFTIVDKLINDLISEQYKPVGLFELMLIDYKNNQVSKQDIKDQLLNFLFAGFDTTSTAITWTLFNLATYPAVQQQVTDELACVIAENNTPIANLQLPILEKVIKESLRLYPPVWSYAREAIADDTINGYKIPAKTLVLISSYALHRHKDFWPQPNEFNISNFEKENFKGKNFAYIPFGQGKRMCIGRALADYQMQIILGKLLQSFHFQPITSKVPIINPNIIIKATKPIKLQVKAILK